MSDGFRVALPGFSISSPPQDLAVDSDFANLKCDLRKNPKNYGIINISVANVPFGTSANAKIIYQQPHGYNYVPSFLTAWNYPQGTNHNANALNNSTFGIGDLDGRFAFFDTPNTTAYGPYLAMYVDAQNFYISIYASSTTGHSEIVSNFIASVRFYIFADSFDGS